MKFRAHKFFAFCQLDSRQATLKSRRTSHRDISICFGLLRWQVMTTFYGEPSSSARCMGAVKHLPETVREICRRWKSKYKTKNNKLEAYRRDEKRAQLAQKRPTTMKSEGIEYDSMGSDHYSDLVKVFRVQLSQVSQRDDLFFFFCCWLYIFHFSLLSALSFHYIIFISLFFGLSLKSRSFLMFIALALFSGCRRERVHESWAWDSDIACRDETPKTIPSLIKLSASENWAKQAASRREEKHENPLLLPQRRASDACRRWSQGRS